MVGGESYKRKLHPYWSKNQAQEAKLRDAFASIDKDGNGYIDSKELKAVLKSMGHRATSEEVMELFKLMDLDQSGTIDFDEFANAMAVKAEDEETDKGIQELFNVLDTDATGSLSREELQRGLKILGVKLSLEEVDILISEIDKDGDGEITCEEFVEYVVTFDDEDHHDGQAGGH